MSSKDIRSFFKPITKRNKFSELINQLPDSETSTAKIQEHFEVGTNNFMKKELEKNRTDSSNVNSDSSSDVKKKGGKKVVRNPTVNLNHCKNKKLETGLPLEESSIVSSSDSDDSNIINATPSKCKQKKKNSNYQF
ncbi:hypothetical protein HHI36_004801 [Cryptolaemus montrouzieri]|uniref:Uncharacterized protein n=1 Tax=Cryptolaemus montrouzieri TaxID=559131 RepID=A0ABD2NSJ2_9CUCU